MIRWLLLGAGILCIAGGVYGYRALQSPQMFSLEAVRQGKLPATPALVTLPASVDDAHPWYNLRNNLNVRVQAEQLSKTSTADGIPLLDPAEIPQSELAELKYTRVRVRSDISDLLERKLIPCFYEHQPVSGQGDQAHWVNQYFVRIRRQEPVWALSGAISAETQPAGNLGLYTPPPVQVAQRPEEIWKANNEFSGALRPLSDVNIPGQPAAQIASLLGVNNPDDAWIVDTSSDSYLSGKPGWHCYFAVQEAHHPIWVQAPLMSTASIPYWKIQCHGQITGVWLPAGKHHFVPAADGNAASPVALILTGQSDIEAFRSQSWQTSPWRFIGFAGPVMLIVSTILFFHARLLRRSLRQGLPNYLQPFAEYIVPESPTRLMVHLLLAALAYSAALACFFAAFAGPRSIGEFTNPLAILGCIAALVIGLPLAWLLVGLGQMLIARSATTVLGRRSQRPILYLRSFGADARWFDTWTDLFWMLAFPGRSETAERSLAKSLRGVGPMIAIGKPGEMLPPSGAARMYVQHDRWQDVVVSLVKESQLVVLRIGSTTGFWWELEHVIKACNPQRILIYVPPQDRATLYPMLRDRCRQFLPFPLPDHPGNAWFVGFGPDWQPRLYDGGSRAISQLRQVLLGSPGPSIRDSLNAPLRGLGQPTRGMPLQFLEWYLLSIPVVVLAMILAVVFLISK